MRTDSDSMWTSSDSVGLCASPHGLAWNTWGSVKTSIFYHYLLYFSHDFAKSVLRIHFVPQFETVVSPLILDRFA
jgi:hypothetical protein